MRSFILIFIIGLGFGVVIGWGLASSSGLTGPEGENGVLLGAGSSGASGDEVEISRLSEMGEGGGRNEVALSQTFSHPEQGFSLKYPANLAVKRFDEGQGAETNIVFQKPGEQEGFQIFIVPFNGETLTRERILRDTPSGVIEDPREVLIGAGGGVRALAFLSRNSIIGETREVWFIHRGYLYEVTVYRPLDAWLAGILNTLRFE